MFETKTSGYKLNTSSHGGTRQTAPESLLLFSKLTVFSAAVLEHQRRLLTAHGYLSRDFF